jgi:hypothetical protein
MHKEWEVRPQLQIKNVSGQALCSSKPGERGATTLEFALILPLFIALVFGIIEFGHTWYIYHAVTNASREGARLGVRYRINSAGLRVAPWGFNDPSIDTFVRDYLKQFFDADYVDNQVQVIPSGTAAAYNPTFPATGVDPVGMDFTVTVSAPKSWFILGPLIGLQDLNIQAETKMNIE